MKLKETIKISIICLGTIGILTLSLNHMLPGLIMLSVACLGGMVYSNENVIGN